MFDQEFVISLLQDPLPPDEDVVVMGEDVVVVGGLVEVGVVVVVTELSVVVDAPVDSDVKEPPHAFALRPATTPWNPAL